MGTRIIALVIGFFMVFSGSSYAQVAQDFTLSSTDGERVVLSEYRGKENVLLVFGATWCPYCVKEVPDLNALYEKYDGKGLKILSINVGEPQGKVKRFWEKKGARYTVLVDQKQSVARAYGVSGIPDNIFVTKEGEIAYRGHLDVQRIESLIE